ncbi:PspA/IM30 family protein [Methylosinus sp. Sm6]|uniref:PspA/IM30 family protein n=1 Tax=Methylosinus sp. Sm6 TaxID=2866948 RepID=UPI001C99053F|nr:PspA/IM30 family protein [Methylosinus sp. Sm6]MBY6242018.1 PspA/IM30 family protein [Methylosinus sp. Sm6]
MTESIATRVKRILSASIADLVDRLEAAQGESVMKETIREIELVIDEARVESGRAAAKRLQAVRQAQMTRDKIADLARRAKEALEESREDLAEAAISRQIDLEAQIVALAGAECDAGNAEDAIERDIAALTARKKEMEESLAAFVSSRREAERNMGFKPEGGMTPDRRAENAAAAFDRAMKATAGDMPAMAPVRAETSAQLAELDVLLRQKQVAERLAALKASM